MRVGGRKAALVDNVHDRKRDAALCCHHGRPLCSGKRCPTGYEVGVLNGGVRPGDVVAIVGSGPVGLSAISGARLFSPSHIVAIDLADSRLEAAKMFGADVTVNNARQDPVSVTRRGLFSFACGGSFGGSGW
jgi:Zn-dependent alcohol dehydrogenase